MTATKSPSSRPSAAAETALRRGRLDPAEARRAVEAPGLGAAVVFEGVVRPFEDGRPIAAILYEAYEAMAEREIARVVAEVSARHGVRLAVFHRLGRVPAGEAGLIVAANGLHREEAFAACRAAVDFVKSLAPIWKSEFEWIESPSPPAS